MANDTVICNVLVVGIKTLLLYLLTDYRLIKKLEVQLMKSLCLSVLLYRIYTPLFWFEFLYEILY